MAPRFIDNIQSQTIYRKGLSLPNESKHTHTSSSHSYLNLNSKSHFFREFFLFLKEENSNFESRV